MAGYKVTGDMFYKLRLNLRADRHYAVTACMEAAAGRQSERDGTSFFSRSFSLPLGRRLDIADNNASV
jgi:hypothetical protein